MSNQTNCVACDELQGEIAMQGSVLVSKMFHEVTGIKVKPFYSICKTCQQELRSCYNFRKRCLEIFNLYNTSESSRHFTSDDNESSQIFANPLATSEITIVKNETSDPGSTAVTFHEKEDAETNFDDFNPETTLDDDDDDFDGGNVDDFDTGGQQYDDINPPMSDDDDEGTSNDADFDESTPRFECDECSKTFSKRSRLVAHKAEHRNERLYTCPRSGCNSAFNVPHRLTRHLKNVHDADEDEINESTFAVVEDNEGVYVVRNSWLFYKDGVPYILYPPASVKNLEDFPKHIHRPGDDWMEYQVKIIRQKMPSYEMTKQLQDFRLRKRNLKCDAGPVPKRLKPSMDSSQSKPHSSNFLPAFSLNNRPMGNQIKQNQGPGLMLMNQGQVNLTAMQTEKMKVMEFNFNTQLRDLKQKLNCLMHMVKGRGAASGSIQSTLENDQFSPKAISCERDFLDMEDNLIAHDRNPMISSEFSIKRERMIDHYACKLKNINKRTNPKIGLIGSLLNLYFAPEFLKTIGWTNAQGRLAVKDMVGHISLFYEIVNRNTPSTYMNMEEASTGLYTFLRRFHEAKNAKHRIKDTNNAVNSDENSKMSSEQSFRPANVFFPKLESFNEFENHQMQQ